MTSMSADPNEFMQMKWAKSILISGQWQWFRWNSSNSFPTSTRFKRCFSIGYSLCAAKNKMLPQFSTKKSWNDCRVARAWMPKKVSGNGQNSWKIGCYTCQFHLVCGLRSFSSNEPQGRTDFLTFSSRKHVLACLLLACLLEVGLQND